MTRRFNLRVLPLILPLLVSCAAAGGRAPLSTSTPAVPTVAVLAFEERAIGAAETTRGIGRTMADRVTEALAGRPDLRLIDRESLQRVLEELSLSSSDLVRSDEQLKLGRLLGAHYLIAGGITAVGDHLRIDARIIEVEKGVADGAFIQGAIGERAAMERDFSVRLANQVAAKSEVPKSAPRSGHDFFLQGVRLERADNPAQALEMYQKTLSLDPDHREARDRMERLLLKETE